MLKKNSGKMNFLLVLICIVLLGAVGFLLVKNKEEKQAVADKIERTVQEVDSAVQTEEKTVNKETTKQKPEKDKEDTEEATKTAEEEKASEEPKNTLAEAKGIVCWGDDLINGAESETYSYMAVLQKLLNEKGYQLPVINKTLQGGGTLSMMKMAGVSDSVLQGYITAHQQAANGKELYITEKGIRDLTAEQMERNDLECIPVIFMGYYGGWNHDPAELAQQQEHILKTFPDQERFLVVGTRPVDDSVDSASLDQVLQEKWKEHYISLAQVTSYPASTYEAQEAMAQAILAKMEELSYIALDKQGNTNEKTETTP